MDIRRLKNWGYFVSVFLFLTIISDSQRPWNNEILLPQLQNATGMRNELPSPYSSVYGQERSSQPVYGPVYKSECKRKYEILDPRNIYSTRKEIEQCNSAEFISCTYAEHSMFRTIDGRCNNVQHPTWGKASSCYQRVLPFDYGDQKLYPRISCTGQELPNPRLISNTFHKEVQLQHDQFTTHFLEWGQMLAHDLTLNDIFWIKGSQALRCCDSGPQTSDKCMSIPVPPSDTFYPIFGKTCFNFVRTMPCPCSTVSGKRLHWNKNTAYHDLSLTYGSTEEEAQKLRSGIRGMLGVEYNDVSGPMPPTVSVQQLCVSPNREKSCYKTGDARANQNPFILTAQTYLLRHHNFICQELNEINPHWEDERLYQEARRINNAIAQFITFKNYLPNVLGEIMTQEKLEVEPGATYTRYDPELDAGILNEYSTFAARYGHTLIPGRLSEVDPLTEEREEVLLRNRFFTPFGFRYGEFDRVVKGMTLDREMQHDISLSDDVRNFLGRRLYLNITFGSDLAAASIIRGRDHGIPGYTYYQTYLFNNSVHSFTDLRRILPRKSVDLLEELYQSVHDIDTYSAGLAEYSVPGGFVGPTFGVILGQQYKRTKFGDRYWFEHGGQAGSFTPEQLVEIKRATLARILCETTRIRKVQMEPFLPPSQSNPVVPCDEIHRFDFMLWKE